MPGPYRRRKTHCNDKHLKRKYRTKNRTKDLDEINDEIVKEEKVAELLNQDVDADKPGEAQFYCIHCSRYFIDGQAMEDHFKTKPHKRRLKALELEPYSLEDAERAAGHGSFVQPKKRKIVTQTPIQE